MKIKFTKVAIFSLLTFLIFLGFFFNFKLNDKKVSFNFTNAPSSENGMLRKLIYISGEVKNPGVYEFSSDMRVVEAIDLAGGFSESADPVFVNEKLNLAERLKDEQKIFIPSTTISTIETTVNPAEENDLININSASLAELDSLPGIGPATAQKIIDARPYSAKEDLLNVSGIGDAKFGEISELIGL